ncbi:YeeE/YedE thiosulfate transporter family protein [Pseudogemmobacter humi]|uniref:Putative inner membrane protein n=1 Tax=Pseudogemmobacter humi TaxID=2483812 RepID=A0A3P5X4L2_9RHOB|nr:YeeE/YedE thiosulfate transporter family protein [Pseudogemmobacter humi]VDC29223.1 putative inner membrane protein [Pseudogemmobacter humi]
MSAVFLGLILGAVFGAAARAGRFCLLRGMKGVMGGGDLSALRAFALALAVAIPGTQILNLAGLTDLSASLPLRGQFPVLGLALGGAIFGLGMVMANACGARSLVLFAGGNLRSLLVLLCLGLAAQASLTGVLLPLRQALQLGVITPQWLTLTDAFASVLPRGAALAIAAGVPALALSAFAWPLIRRAPVEALAATVVGLCVIAGWWIVFATDDPFDPKLLNSLSFIAPVGEGLLWLMLATGREAGFALAVVGGTIAGAFAVALITRSFTLETFGSGRHSLFAAIGGIFMGFGGVLAMGCSIGQGLTGVSTLSLASLVAFLGILAGLALGLVILRQPNTGR